MKSMKRSMVVILTLVLCMGMIVSACSKKQETSAGTGDKNAAQTTTSSDAKSSTDDASKDAPPAATQEKVTLDFWTFWGSETRRPIIEKIIDDFNKSQDHIVVKHTFLPWGDIWTKNLAAIAAGNPPDVIVNDINTVPQRAEKKQNTNLTPFIGTEDISSRFFPELWKTVLYKNEPYALPFNTDTRLLFYNKKAFEEVGLDPNKPPATWDELMDYAKKLDKKNGSNYERIGFYPLWGNWGWDNWMMNADNGVGFFDKDGNVTINTPNKVAALKWINSWTDRYGRKTVDAFKASFGSKQADPFISGKVAMEIQTATFYTQIRDYGQGMDFGVAPIPEFKPGSGHYSSGGGFVVEIPYGAKHPKESWEFLKYLTDVHAQQYWADKNYDNVANIEASNDPELQKEYVYKAAVENLKVTKLFPVPLSAPDFRNLLNPQVDAALLGKTPPDKALEKAQADVENLVKQNQK